MNLTYNYVGCGTQHVPLKMADLSQCSHSNRLNCGGIDAVTFLPSLLPNDAKRTSLSLVAVGWSNHSADGTVLANQI